MAAAAASPGHTGSHPGPSHRHRDGDHLTRMMRCPWPGPAGRPERSSGPPAGLPFKVCRDPSPIRVAAGRRSGWRAKA
eukprot:1421144-Rhodomonas_salina.2